MRPRPTEDYLTIREAIAWYRTSRATLYRLIGEGRLTPQKRDHDRRTWLRVDELEVAMRARPVEERQDG